MCRICCKKLLSLFRCGSFDALQFQMKGKHDDRILWGRNSSKASSMRPMMAEKSVERVNCYWVWFLWGARCWVRRRNKHTVAFSAPMLVGCESSVIHSLNARNMFSVCRQMRFAVKCLLLQFSLSDIFANSDLYLLQAFLPSFCGCCYSHVEVMWKRMANVQMFMPWAFWCAKCLCGEHQIQFIITLLALMATKPP